MYTFDDYAISVSGMAGFKNNICYKNNIELQRCYGGNSL